MESTEQWLFIPDPKVVFTYSFKKSSSSDWKIAINLSHDQFLKSNSNSSDFNNSQHNYLDRRYVSRIKIRFIKERFNTPEKSMNHKIIKENFLNGDGIIESIVGCERTRITTLFYCGWISTCFLARTSFFSQLEMGSSMSII